MKFWRNIRAFLDSDFPEAVIISEWGNPRQSLAAGFHMDFLLHFGPTRYNDLFREKPFFCKKGGGDFSLFAERYADLSSGGEGLICIPSGNHDMPRIASFLDEDDLKIAFAFLLSMPGAPFIYYGDEIGMRYLEGVPSVEGGFERTGSRSPMQWDDSLNAGFSSARPEDLYIPIDAGERRPTAESQMKDPKSLWSETRKLIAVRKRHEALQSESPVEFLYVKPGECPIAYRRGAVEEAITVALNPSCKPVSLMIEGLRAETGVVCFTGRAPSLSDGAVALDPSSGVFL